MKRGIIISDTHCGNKWGLTAEGYLTDENREIQIIFWNWFSKNVAKYGPYDFLLGLGDFTDGEGKKGVLDTTITDVNKQAECAEKILLETHVDPKCMYLVRGTPFHSNGSGEYEDKIAVDLGCSIKDTQKIEIEGWKIHTRHVVGRSDIPYGQGTPLFKELSRLEHEAFRDNKSAPDIVFRGHCHYSCYVGKHGRMVINSPCLELPLSSANGRRYSAWEYDVGFGVLTLDKDKEPIYQPVIMEINLVHSGNYERVTFKDGE
jgi:predicted phosphodiesterase